MLRTAKYRLRKQDLSIHYRTVFAFCSLSFSPSIKTYHRLNISALSIAFVKRASMHSIRLGQSRWGLMQARKVGFSATPNATQSYEQMGRQASLTPATNYQVANFVFSNAPAAPDAVSRTLQHFRRRL